MKIQMFSTWLLIFVICFGFGCLGLDVPAFADSLWGENSASPYSQNKLHKVGDLVNIIILESSSAKNLAGTKTGVKDDLSLKYAQTFARLAPIIGSGNTATANVENKFDGSGQTTRGSNVTARFAAWVTEILPNGNLAVQGKHKVEVNEEMQEITISGVVRPKDISSANTIYSYQVANANLAIKGTGSVADSESPGWLSRLFNWLF